MTPWCASGPLRGGQCGAEPVRTRFSTLKRWAMEVAKRRGLKRAKVALARKMGDRATMVSGVDQHRCRWGKEAPVAALREDNETY